MIRRYMPTILDPLPVRRVENRYQSIQEANQLIPLVTHSAALGDYSRNILLKIPYVNDFERVASATTLPIVILGGDRSGGMDMAAIVKKAMESGHQVRGAMLGRNVLYPENGTPASVSETIGSLIHPAD